MRPLVRRRTARWWGDRDRAARAGLPRTASARAAGRCAGLRHATPWRHPTTPRVRSAQPLSGSAEHACRISISWSRLSLGAARRLLRSLDSEFGPPPPISLIDGDIGFPEGSALGIEADWCDSEHHASRARPLSSRSLRAGIAEARFSRRPAEPTAMNETGTRATDTSPRSSRRGSEGRRSLDGERLSVSARGDFECPAGVAPEKGCSPGLSKPLNRGITGPMSHSGPIYRKTQ